MAVIKIACPKCGQKVSGDETFYGRSVNCPICTSKIIFPENPAVPDLDSLAHTGDPPPLDPSLGNLPAADQPVTGETPSFDTIPPSSPDSPSPPDQPAFETIQPGNHLQPGLDAVTGLPPGPAYDNTPDQNLPPVPAAPEIPPADQNEEVPSPLLGTISLVVGILNTVTACVGGILLAPVAIITGHMALAKAKHSPVKPAPGQSLATIGVILGYAGLLFTIIGLIALLAFKAPILEIINSNPA